LETLVLVNGGIERELVIALSGFVEAGGEVEKASLVPPLIAGLK